MEKIVECIPNFSEGKDEAKIDLIAKTIESVPEVAVLSRHMDPDHNRSVITFAGTPEAVLEASYRAAETAVELIDLNAHTGEHPRIGALDVLPFVPIRGVTMDDCITLAKRAGERIARDLKIPVYLYERAATRPDREELANLRRGEFEKLRREIETEPHRAPDFGEPRVHPTAGAIAIAARSVLIAFNVNLASQDVNIARKVALAVRGSSGGLQSVKALGMEMTHRNRVQVSMNFTNYEVSPLHRAVELIRREAQRYGVAIAGTEIVGLAPQAALNACAEYYLQIEDFKEDLILEHRLESMLRQRAAVVVVPPPDVRGEPADAPLRKAEDETAGMAMDSGTEAPEAPEAMVAEPSETPIATYADVIRSGQHPPDGVAIAAYAGALGAALGGLICRQTMTHRPQVRGEVQGTFDQLDELRADLYNAINEDAETREIMLDAVSLPRDTVAENLARASAIEEAAKNAIAIPLRVAENCAEVLELLSDLKEIGNPSVFADLASAAQMAMTAMRGATYNIFANMLEINDEEFNRTQRVQITELVTRGQRVTDEIEAIFFRRYPR
jgi:glutamate formiminotransferase/formiminotetrahydrofolate cyclodeaminase